VVSTTSFSFVTIFCCTGGWLEVFWECELLIGRGGIIDCFGFDSNMALNELTLSPRGRTMGCSNFSRRLLTLLSSSSSSSISLTLLILSSKRFRRLCTLKSSSSSPTCCTGLGMRFIPRSCSIFSRKLLTLPSSLSNPAEKKKESSSSFFSSSILGLVFIVTLGAVTAVISPVVRGPDDGELNTRILSRTDVCFEALKD